MHDALIVIGINLFLLFLIWRLYFFEYRSYRLDLTRQKLFRIRDELFEEFDRNGWSFDYKAYGMMRRTLNGVIQFNHRLSLTRIWAAAFADHHVTNGALGQRFEADYSQALQELPDEARAAVESARKQMHLALVEHMVWSSLPITIIAGLAYCLLIPHRAVSVLLKRFSSFDAEAEGVGRKTASA